MEGRQSFQRPPPEGGIIYTSYLPIRAVTAAMKIEEEAEDGDEEEDDDEDEEEEDDDEAKALEPTYLTM